MQYISKNLKRLISICLITLLIVTSILAIAPEPARADENKPIITEQKLACVPINKERLERVPITDRNNNQNDGSIFQDKDIEALTAILTGTIATAGLGSIKLLTITSTAHGIMALLGAGTVTTISAPVAGVVAAGGLLTYGGYKAYEYLQNQDKNPMCYGDGDLEKT